MKNFPQAACWRISRAVYCLAVSGTSLLALSAPGFAQTTTATDPTPSGSDVVVVTAQRRETAIMDTPEAITALDGDAIKATGGEGLADIAALTPSLSYSENFGISQVFIRGVGNNFLNPGGDPGVAMYADGVYHLAQAQLRSRGRSFSYRW